MSNEIDIARICESCIFLQENGEIMVGCIQSGGPEMSYKCRKGNNLSYKKLDAGQCSEYKSNSDEEYD